MPPSADPAREALVGAIIALERACLDADAAIVERRWSDIEAAFSAQAELTRDLERSFADNPELSRDAKIARRMQGIVAFRNDQLRRLCNLRDDAAVRLQSIAKVNAFARSFGPRRDAARLLDAQY